MAETYENLLENVTPDLEDTIRVVTSEGNTRKATMSAVAEALLTEDTDVEYDTTAQSVQGAINELNTETALKASISIEGTTLVID